ncbi:hypothetical protein [Ferroplasma sp.]|uniref:hypothetical protein n=1 Tax=Ferroplasma sp. TaxID=2591003 RepID=UPI00307E0326
MTIYELKPKRPFRRIDQKDIGKVFGSTDKLMNRITLKDFYNYSKIPNQDAIVLSIGGEIVVAITIQQISFKDLLQEYCGDAVGMPKKWELNEDDKCAYIDYLNKNSKSKHASDRISYGYFTLTEAINYCRKLSVKAVFLFSDGTDPDNLFNKFYKYMGFVKKSKRYFDATWGGDLILTMLSLV